MILFGAKNSTFCPPQFFFGKKRQKWPFFLFCHNLPLNWPRGMIFVCSNMFSGMGNRMRVIFKLSDNRVFLLPKSLCDLEQLTWRHPCVIIFLSYPMLLKIKKTFQQFEDFWYARHMQTLEMFTTLWYLLIAPLKCRFYCRFSLSFLSGVHAYKW